MEDKMAWRRVHGELVENHRLAQDMNATLAESSSCRSQLLSCLTAKEKRKNGGAGGEGGWRFCSAGRQTPRCLYFSFLLKCDPIKHQCIFIVLTNKDEPADQNIPELLKKLDCLHQELGKMFQRSVVF